MNIKLLLAFMMLLGLLTSCKKDTVLVSTLNQNQIIETKMLWVTPTGITIPYEESHRWEEYVAEKLSLTKSDPPKKKYESFRCTTSEGNCGLKCVESTYSSCTSAFDCLTCVNCCLSQ